MWLLKKKYQNTICPPHVVANDWNCLALGKQRRRERERERDISTPLDKHLRSSLTGDIHGLRALALGSQNSQKVILVGLVAKNTKLVSHSV
jgi:hypothetical protein